VSCASPAGRCVPATLPFSVFSMRAGRGAYPRPVRFPPVRRSSGRREAAAFLGASFAFGGAFSRSGTSCRAFSRPFPLAARRLDRRGAASPTIGHGLSHRFVFPKGCTVSSGASRAAYLDHGSLERFYIVEGRGTPRPPAGTSRVPRRIPRPLGENLPRERDFLFSAPGTRIGVQATTCSCGGSSAVPDGVDLGCGAP